MRDEIVEYQGLVQKVPQSTKDQGDCIWRDADVYEAVRPTYSGHQGELDFNHDVINGESVLLSTKYWYFGKGDKISIRLPERLKQMIPGRGHRSNENDSFRDEFVQMFNNEIKLGQRVHGTPEHAPENTDKATCSRCRIKQDEDDQIDEEK